MRVRLRMCDKQLIHTARDRDRSREQDQRNGVFTYTETSPGDGALPVREMATVAS